MTRLSRRTLLQSGASAGALLAGVTVAGGFGVVGARSAGGGDGFAAAAGKGGPGPKKPAAPGLQGVTAICEVTGGGEKVYGVAVQYDAAIDAASLAPDTYAASVFPTAAGYFPGLPNGPDKNATADPAKPRPIASLYTNDAPALRGDQKSAPGAYVIAEFAHDPDLSLPTTDRDLVAMVQTKDVKAASGAVYAAAPRVWTNAGERGNDVAIRGVVRFWRRNSAD